MNTVPQKVLQPVLSKIEEQFHEEDNIGQIIYKNHRGNALEILEKALNKKPGD